MSSQEKYEAIISSFANGQHTQAIEQIKKLGVVKFIEHMDMDETLNDGNALYILKTFFKRTRKR